MALSENPQVSFTPASGVAFLALAPQPFDNTHSILVVNPDAVNDVLIFYGDPAAATAAASTRVPPGASITLGIGTIGVRGEYGLAATRSLCHGTSAGVINPNVTYLNAFGVEAF
jgi:hypothetical protein